jgi:acyl-lipid omega-6 desaturase (Delta-12 desaturase)
MIAGCEYNASRSADDSSSAQQITCQIVYPARPKLVKVAVRRKLKRDELNDGAYHDVPAMSIPCHRDLFREFSCFAKSSTSRGVFLFVLDISLYVASLAAVLFVTPLVAKLFFSVLAGAAQARLMVIGHDAAHGSLVVGARLNRLLATIALTLVHYNLRLWTFEHHRLHHPHANDARPDAFTPLSKSQFDAMPGWRRLLHRVYRAPNLVGFGLYYVIERYWWTKVVRPEYLPRALRASAWLHTCLLLAWLATLATVLWLCPLYGSNLSPVNAVLLGLVTPFFSFQCQNGFALYSQHTDPTIPWFLTPQGGAEASRGELLSVYLRTPRPMGIFYHDIFCHSVHHLHPRIPCYRLHAAQERLCQRLGDHAIVRSFGPRWIFTTMAKCKLYDWNGRRWLGFDGKPN